MIGKINQPSTHLIMDVDGTLKAGAVDGAAALADDVVSNAKLANMTRGTVKVGGTSDAPTDLDAKTSGCILIGDGTDLKSVAVSGDATITAAGVVTVPAASRAGPNMIWDGLNRLNVGDIWDTRPRWYTQTNLVMVPDDANNPFAPRRRTLQISTASTVGGKWIYFDEAGIKNGDTIQIKALGMGASGTCRIDIRPFNSVGTLIGTSDQGATITQDGTTKLLNNTYTVVDSDAVGILVYIAKSAAGVEYNLYAMWANHNSVSDYPPADDASLSSIFSFVPVQYEFGRPLLHNWHRKTASLSLGNAEQIVMAMIGDSWFDSSIGVVNKLIPMLQTTYGDAGPGYVGFAPTTAHGLGTPNVTLSKAGTWTYSDQAATSRGPDLAHAAASEAASVAITATFESAIIHYIANVGAGEFRWRIDAGAWTTVNTSAGAEAHATETISGLSAASHDLDIEWVSGSIVMLGADLQESANGVRLHRLGNSGATALDWTENDATIWSDAMAALDPDVCVILLGTNDHSNNIVPATFLGYMTTLIDRIQAEFGVNCDIFLLSPGYNGLVRTHQLTSYISALHEAAAAQRVTMLDTFQTVTPYASDGVGGWANSSHLDATGYQVFANEIARFLAA